MTHPPLMGSRTGMLRMLSLALVLGCSMASGETPLKLWPGSAPGDTGTLPQEADTSGANGRMVSGKSVIRLGNVSTPTLTFFPAPDKTKAPAVLVCPGGGYNILAWDLEGTEICEWLNSLGIHAVLLKYRVPARPGRTKHDAALQDAQRALGLMRQNAEVWNIDAKRIGVIGFSAGGHLAATLSTNDATRGYPVVDSADKTNCRPDFSILIYPAYLTLQKEGDKIAPELKPSEHTPPTFIVMTQDDSVRVENALFYSLALKNAKVPCELHIYPAGGHGYGLRPSNDSVSSWPLRAAEWLRARKILSP